MYNYVHVRMYTCNMSEPINDATTPEVWYDPTVTAALTTPTDACPLHAYVHTCIHAYIHTNI